MLPILVVVWSTTVTCKKKKKKKQTIGVTNPNESGSSVVVVVVVFHHQGLRLEQRVAVGYEGYSSLPMSLLRIQDCHFLGLRLSS
jgi:hypothetical protein